MPIVTDTFTDAAGTNLEAHTGEVGATWTVGAEASGAASAKIDSSNRLRSAAAIAAYYASGVPATANYYASADITYLSAVTSATAGVEVRSSTSANTKYFARFNQFAPGWELFSVVAGSYTSIGTSATPAFTSGTKNLNLSASGTTITVSVDGTAIITVTNSDVSAKGRAGVRFDVAQANGTGMVLDNFSAVDFTTIAVNDANWWRTPLAYYVSGSTSATTNVPGNESRIKFSSATTGTLLVDQSAMSTSTLAITYSVDGGAWTDVTLSSATTSVLMGAGTSFQWKIKSIVGNVDRWTTPVLSLVETGFTITDAVSTVAWAPAETKYLLSYGDSIAEAERINDALDLITSTDCTKHYAVIVAAALNANLINRAIGGGGWVQAASGNTPPQFTVGDDTNSSWNKYYAGKTLLSGGLYATQPDYILTEYGRNDSSSISASLAGWLAAARTAAPNAWIFVCIPFSRARASEFITGLNSAATSHTTAVVDDVTIYTGTADKKMVVLDLGTNLSDGIPDSSGSATYKTTDGVHPNLLGHEQAAGKIAKAIQFAITPYGGGPNAITLTYTSDGSTPLVGASVWITSDSAGLIPVSGVLLTDSSGHAIFNLTTGTTYYANCTYSGRKMANQSFTA